MHTPNVNNVFLFTLFRLPSFNCIIVFVYKKKTPAIYLVYNLSLHLLRLTAPYLFMLGVVEVTMKWFAHNAVFEPPAMDHETCPQYWWRNLLYINTLFPVEQMVGYLRDTKC